MPSLKYRQPKYCLHKQSGQARVWIHGKEYLLGLYNSPDSKAKYHELLARHLTGQPAPKTDTGPTISQVLALFWRYAKRRYHKGGKGKFGGAVSWRPGLRVVRETFGKEPAKDFGPKKLKAIQDAMIAKGWSRSDINDQVNRIRRAFRWAASEEHIPAEVVAKLETVDGLRYGITEAKEAPPVEPVEDSVVEATLPHMSAKVADMVMVQRLVGCRPGEVVRLRVGDVDRSGDVWTITLRDHKTAHHNKARVLYVGPRAQQILAPYLLKLPDCWVFPSRPGRHYGVDAYRNAIHRACDRGGLPRWSPNQLRHTAGSAVRAQFGLEGAQAVLGHSDMKTSEIYAERLQGLAIEAVKKLG